MEQRMQETYIITGATGFLGRLIAEHVIRTASGCGKSVLLLCPVRDAASAADALRALCEEPNADIRLIACDVREMTPALFPGVEQADYLIHCASPTDSRFMTEHPVETADVIVNGTLRALELAKHFRVRSMVYLSSMEVYGTVEDIGRPRTEEELGDVPLTSPRSSYPLGKRMAEWYCHGYFTAYGVPVKIARLAQTFGCGVRKEDRRVFMQFAQAVKEKRNIVLQTTGQSVGNYCAPEDVLNAIVTIMEQGENGACYNVVNEACTMRIADMAEFVCREIANGSIAVEFAVEPSVSPYAPETKLSMSSERLRALGWTPTKGLREMYEEILET